MNVPSIGRSRPVPLFFFASAFSLSSSVMRGTLSASERRLPSHHCTSHFPTALLPASHDDERNFPTVKTNTLFNILAFGIFILLRFETAAKAQVSLSGIALYSTDGSGNFLDDGWNTLGGDVMYNLWVSANGNPINGPTDASASVNFPLTPGTYTFSISGDSGRNRAFHGLNLFFNGNNNSPRISVMAPTATNTMVTSFTANQSANTPNLAYTSLVSSGANSFNLGGFNVALTGFRWQYSTVESKDLVSPFTPSPNGKLDNQGIFTLTVSNAAVSSVSGSLYFERIVVAASAQNVTFTLRPTDGGANITRTVAVPPSGAFNLSGLTPKPYTLHIKSAKHLATNVSVDTTNGNVSGVTAFLPAGDANNDNSVDSTDFGVLIGAYGSDGSIPGSGYDVTADL